MPVRAVVGEVSLWYDVLSPSVQLQAERVVERPVLIGVHGGPGVDSTALVDVLEPLTDVAHDSV